MREKLKQSWTKHFERIVIITETCHRTRVRVCYLNDTPNIYERNFPKILDSLHGKSECTHKRTQLIIWIGEVKPPALSSCPLTSDPSFCFKSEFQEDNGLSLSLPCIMIFASKSHVFTTSPFHMAFDFWQVLRRNLSSTFASRPQSDSKMKPDGWNWCKLSLFASVRGQNDYLSKPQFLCQCRKTQIRG